MMVYLQGNLDSVDKTKKLNDTLSSLYNDGEKVVSYVTLNIHFRLSKKINPGVKNQPLTQ